MRIELCTRASKIGCFGIISFIVLGSLVPVIMMPRILLIYGFYLPLAPLCLFALRDFRQSMDQFFEVGTDHVALYDRESLCWQLNWDAVAMVRSVWGGLEFVDRLGNGFRVPLMNVPRTQSRAIRAFFPLGLPVETRQKEFLGGMSKWLGYALGIFGGFLLLWGGLGVLQTIVLFRTSSPTSDPPNVNLSLLLWQSLALMAGLFTGTIGWSRIFRNPSRIVSIESTCVTLDNHLSAQDKSPLANQTVTWRARRKIVNGRKSVGWIMLFACTFWGLMFVGVIREVIEKPREMPLFWMYTVVIAFHAFGVYAWTQMLNPREWTIQTHQSDVWVVGTHATHSSRLKRGQESWLVEFSVGGKNKQLYARDFERSPDPECRIPASDPSIASSPG